MPHWIGSNRKRSKQLTTADQKFLETEFSKASHLSSVRRQMPIEKNVSNGILSTFVVSINAFDCRLLVCKELKLIVIVFDTACILEKCSSEKVHI